MSAPITDLVRLAIELVQSLGDRWGQPLRLYYPRHTLWSDQPAVVLRGDWVTPEQRAAASAWLRFLEGPAMQIEAARMGLGGDAMVLAAGWRLASGLLIVNIKPGQTSRPT